MAARVKGGFAKCLEIKLQKRPNWGKEKIAEAKRVWERQRDENVDAGMALADAERAAASTVVEMIEFQRQAKVKAGLKNIAILDDMRMRLDESLSISTAWGKGDASNKLGVGLRSVIDEDVRMEGRQNYETLRQTTLGEFWSLMRDAMDNFGKGALGRKLGKAHMPNVARELFNANSTGDTAAHEIATAYRKIVKYYLSKMNNETGASIRNVSDDGMPTAFSAVNVNNTPVDNFVADLIDRLDWNKTRRPSGERIPVAEREQFLKDMHFAIRNGDYTGFDKEFAATSGRWATEFQQERIFQYKSADAWQEMHDKYADMDIHDVIVHAMEKYAYNYSLAKTFGNSPDYMVKQMRGMAVKKANVASKRSDKIGKELRLYDTMADSMLRHNAMDPESFGAYTVATTSNLATAAMLKSAVLISAPSDLLITMSTRLANNQPLVSFIGSYIKAMFPGNYRKMAVEMLNAGFIIDDLTSNNFIAARFGAGAQYGAAWSKRVTDFTMRTSLMSRTTNALRIANHKDMMSRVARLRNTPFDQIPEKDMFRRAGITAAEWDKLRENMPLWSPVQGTEFFRPVDLPDDLQVIGRKFQSMFWNEGRRMVLATSLEGAARLRRGLRPENAIGALAHSASMYMGFPVTNFLTFSRLVMALDSRPRALGLIGALGIGGTLVGALAMQLRGLTQGKELADMTDPQFWIKAAAGGGAFGIWGDYITGAMRSDTSAQMIAKAGGPLVSMAADFWDLTAGTAFQWAEIGERTTNWTAGGKMADLIDFARQNVLPQTWMYAYALERDILEPLQEMLDPVGTKRSQSRRTRMAKDQGQPFRRGAEPGRGFLTGP